MDIGRFAFLQMHGSLDSKVMLEEELQRNYDSVINVRIAWLWGGGIDVRLGDEMNGYFTEENFSTSLTMSLLWGMVLLECTQMEGRCGKAYARLSDTGFPQASILQRNYDHGS